MCHEELIVSNRSRNPVLHQYPQLFGTYTLHLPSVFRAQKLQNEAGIQVQTLGG